MKMPKIKSKKASELIKSILKRDSNKFFPEIQKKNFHWENIPSNNSSPIKIV